MPSKVRSINQVAALIFAASCCAHAFSQTPPAAPRSPTEKPAAGTKTAENSTATRPPGAEPFDKASAKLLGDQCVKLETETGVIELEMLADSAPETVRNFLNLSATGAFDSTAFSRVIPGFIVQGGNLRTHQNLTAELAERARRTIPDEPNAVKHVRGVVSMARPETPNSATTNFFILVGEGAHLDGKFAAFARVRTGMDVADAINRGPVEGEKPLTPIRLKRATVSPCAAAEKPDPKDPARD